MPTDEFFQAGDCHHLGLENPVGKARGVPWRRRWERLVTEALDPETGQLRWEFRHASPPMAGILSTAGHLVFSGDMEGNFMAFDARKGENLWHVQTGAAIVGSPMTYSVKGKQYVAIASQSVLFVFALPEVQSEPRR